MNSSRNGPSRPAHTVRYGSIKAAIWRNVVDIGNASRPMYNVTFSRSYRDGENNWRDTQSFGYDDLLLVAKIADVCHTWIADQLTRDAQAKKQSEAVSTQ